MKLHVAELGPLSPLDIEGDVVLAGREAIDAGASVLRVGASVLSLGLPLTAYRAARLWGKRRDLADMSGDALDMLTERLHFATVETLAGAVCRSLLAPPSPPAPATPVPAETPEPAPVALPPAAGPSIVMAHPVPGLTRGGESWRDVHARTVALTTADEERALWMEAHRAHHEGVLPEWLRVRGAALGFRLAGAVTPTAPVLMLNGETWAQVDARTKGSTLPSEVALREQWARGLAAPDVSAWLLAEGTALGFVLGSAPGEG